MYLRQPLWDTICNARQEKLFISFLCLFTFLVTPQLNSPIDARWVEGSLEDEKGKLSLHILFQFLLHSFSFPWINFERNKERAWAIIWRISENCEVLELKHPSSSSKLLIELQEGIISILLLQFLKLMEFYENTLCFSYHRRYKHVR